MAEKSEPMPNAESKVRILSVSYDELLLQMRRMILENAGYDVVSAHGLKKSLEECKKGGFDLFILGHSIPNQDKRQMVETFRRKCPSPIISLTRGASEQRVDGADYHIDPDPELMLKLIAETIQKKLEARSNR
jgi:DNA-binding response OmpR family regulator